MNIVKEKAQQVVKKAIELAPDKWMPGGRPDPLGDSRDGYIGMPVSRIDGPHKVAGQARFAAEFALDGMLYAALVYSTLPKGRIAAIDTAAAAAAPGVALVMTHENAPKMAPMPLFMSAQKAAAGEKSAVMQDERVGYNGQPVALVLAATQEQADHACTLVRAEYEAEPAVTSLEAAKARGSEPGAFMGEPLKKEVGDAEDRLARAAHKVDAVYRTPRHSHNAIELHAVTVAWEGDTLRLHDATQAVAHTAWSLAQVFGLKEEQVRVSSPFVGGGFGGKTLWRHQVLAAAASKLAGRPVRLTLSRAGVYRVVGGRAPTEQRVAIGAGADGKFEAIVHTGTTVMSPNNEFPEPFILATQCMYGAQSFKLDVEAVRMDMLANTFMRAPGEAVGTFALECAVDELAERLDIDPVELRIRNEPEKDPLEGRPFSSRHLVAAWRMGAERFGWDARQARPGMRQEGEWLVGLGCAAATYPYHRMPGGAARITLRRDGSAHIAFAAHEMGMGTSTTHAMVAAERLGLALEQVTVAYGDSTLPGMILAGGSQQTASVGHAVIAAQRALVAKLLELAPKESALHGLAPDDLAARDGGLCKRDEPQRFETYAALLERAGQEELSAEGEAPPPLEYMHWSMHSYGAIFCEARVNMVTGETRVTRLLGAYDCGRVVNPKTAASQFRGGMIMGMGMALMEETGFDERNGRIMNPSLAEYHVPVHLDVPEIEVIWTDIADPHAPMGARGIGEIGITGTSAAVVNAIYNACGRRVRELPVTLDKLVE
ncbi:xanthine dehydrogenase family protein molybdopterin-binding subunit [Massilia sp.]|uniref:xanthine dehydrogenase family protein molybdopterin-binding subunit n=1 Tax=Massilia sp. TaxID=1882437 RepID=UPI0028A8251C|nr:xanthine dehydrogenase family protein molybdopterin-binding subunit [Massilia sp.]